MRPEQGILVEELRVEQARLTHPEAIVAADERPWATAEQTGLCLMKWTYKPQCLRHKWIQPAEPSTGVVDSSLFPLAERKCKLIAQPGRHPECSKCVIPVRRADERTHAREHAAAKCESARLNAQFRRLANAGGITHERRPILRKC